MDKITFSGSAFEGLQQNHFYLAAENISFLIFSMNKLLQGIKVFQHKK